MANELYVPLIILCFILAYLTGILTVVGMALITRPDAYAFTFVIDGQEEASTADEPPSRTQTIHEKSQATFSSEADVKAAIHEGLAQGFSALDTKLRDNLHG